MSAKKNQNSKETTFEERKIKRLEREVKALKQARDFWKDKYLLYHEEVEARKLVPSWSDLAQMSLQSLNRLEKEEYESLKLKVRRLEDEIMNVKYPAFGKYKGSKYEKIEDFLLDTKFSCVGDSMLKSSEGSTFPSDLVDTRIHWHLKN